MRFLVSDHRSAFRMLEFTAKRQGCRSTRIRKRAPEYVYVTGNTKEAGGAESINDTAYLARSVIRHLEDKDLRSNMGERGRAFVKSGRGAWERVIAMIAPRVEGHVARGSRPPGARGAGYASP